MNIKSTFLTFIFSIILGIVFGQTPNWNPNMLGTCNATCAAVNIPNSNPKGGGNNTVNNGNANIATIYTMSACGLNYVLGSVKTGKRYFPAGPNQPAGIVINGIPACKTILKAYLYVGGSGNGLAFSTTLVNPVLTSSVFPMTAIGNDVDKCWGYTGTYNYRADVTALVTGNGTYSVSGIPTSISTPGNDMDGASLVIIYSDPTQNYTGNIVIGDGCQVNASTFGILANTLTGFNACGNSSFAQCFYIISDLQNILATGLQMNNAAYNFSYPAASNQWWDNIVGPATAVTAGQNNCLFGSTNTADCYNIVTEGLYFQTACNVCSASGLTVTTAVTSTCTIGSATAIVTGGNGPYTYTWTPSALNTSVITNVAPGNYTVTVKDASGCFTGTALAVIPANATTLAVNSATICIGKSATLTAVGGNTYTWTPSATLSSPNGSAVVASPLATTVYTVTGTNTLGCTGTAVSTVVVNPLPVIAVNNPTACLNTPFTLTANGGTAYAWTGPNAFNSALQNPPFAVASPSLNGNYTVMVTSAQGCTNTAVANVSVVPLPTVSIVGTNTLCSQNFNASPNTVVITASGAATYTWTLPAAYNAAPSLNSATVTITPSISVVPTVATLSVTGSNGSCTNSAVYTLTVIPNPTIAVTSASMCAGTSATLFANNATTYTWSPAASLNTANNFSVIASPSITTVYSVIGSSAGCNSQTQNGTAIVVANPTVNSLPSPAVICLGNSINLIASGATTYTWSPNIALTTTLGPNTTANPTITTTYSVLGSQSTCTNIASITVTVLGLPSVTVTPSSPTLCMNNFNGSPNTVSLTASGAATFTWGPIIGLTTNTLNGATIIGTSNGAAMATGTVIGANGTCTNMTTFTVNAIPNPTITVTSGSMCAGTSVVLTANNASTYTWTPTASLNVSNGPSVIASPAVTTVYSVIGSSVGCNSQTKNGTATVVPNPIVSIAPLTPTICFGNSIALTASGAVNYTWSPNTAITTTIGANVTVNPTVTTTYSLIGEQSTCTNTAVRTVTVINLPVVNINLNTPNICMNNFNGSTNTVNINATGAITYTWTGFNGLNASTTSGAFVVGTAIPNSVIGTGTVIGFIGTCSNVASFSVMEIPNPTISVPSASMCFGTSVVLNASGASTYVWAPSNSLSSPFGSSVTASPNITTVYGIVGTSLNCNSPTQISTVVVVANPVITIAPVNPTICAGSAIGLVASGATTYTWSPGNSLDNTSNANVVASPMTTTNYTVIGTLSTCTSLATRQVIAIPLPTLQAMCDRTAICEGEKTNINANGASSYTWIPSNSLSDAYSNFVIADPNVTTVYSLIGNNGLCTTTISVPINVIPKPLLNLTTNNPKICIGQNSTIFASGADGYSWTPTGNSNITNTTSAIVSPSVTTNYTVTGYNYFGNVGCPFTKEIEIEIVPQVTATISNSVAICEGESIKLNADGSNTYVWAPATGLSNSLTGTPYANPKSTTVYTVQISNGGFCGTTATVLVQVNPQPTVSAGPDLIFNSDEPMYLNATGTGTLTWVFGEGILCKVCPYTQIMPTTSSVYQIQTINEFGCKATDDVNVEITNDYNIYIPNVFTPNYDGLNDVFLVYGTGIIKIELFIFDRWGAKLFSSNDQLKGWDGTFKGVESKQDVYTYLVNFTALDNTKHTKTGHVTLMK